MFGQSERSLRKAHGGERAGGRCRGSVSGSCCSVTNCWKCSSSKQCTWLFSRFRGVGEARILAFKPSPLLRVSRGCGPGVTSAAPSPRGSMGKGPLRSSYCWQNVFSCDGGTEVPVFFLAAEPGLLSAPGASCSQAPQQHGSDSSSPRGSRPLSAAGES